MSTAALVLAAGKGERLGHSVPKAFVSLQGSALVVRSMEAMAAVAEIDLVVPVEPPGERQDWSELARAGEGAVGSARLQEKLCGPVSGGALRQDSVAAGLAALPASVEWVAVHDAARCLVASEDVARVIGSAQRVGAAILAQPARDTIKRVRAGLICETPPRGECWVAQTPQVFRVELLREALAKAEAEGVVGTDDAQLVERLGVEVHVVESRSPNWKITLPEDLANAEAWLDSAARG
jgi:2-C-methyl-D-erythritol 4-phosphate cytidylyltransferase